MSNSGVDSQFNKLFEFQKNQDWRLPENIFSEPHFEIQELQDMKKEVNAVKGKLTQFDLAKWSLHTQMRDVAGFVIGQLKRKIKPELLTQAWCKFYEIISRFPSITGAHNANDTFKSLHLCEAPGAFICALNHYLVLNYPNIDWQWHANTLNPYYEGNPLSQMIPDDRLIKHTLSKWLFGADLTGNLLQYYNHVDIVSKVTYNGKVNLITADGSIDCMSDPGEQEKLVEFLHYCETMTALAALASGGTFILKIFTMFEKSTVCLLYLLSCLFEKTFLFKPATSKSGNSELYFVCLGYIDHELSTSAWEKLIFSYKNGCFNENKSMFSLNDIPASFLVQLTSSCSDFFLERQVQTIKENIYFYLNPHELNENNLNRHKSNIARHYIKKYRLSSIPKHYRIVSLSNLHFDQLDLVDLHNIQVLSTNDCIDMLGSISIHIGKRIDVVYTSKFASIKHVQELCHYLTKDQTHPLLYNMALHSVIKTTVVINIRSFNLAVYFEYQRKVFDAVNSAINEGKHIVFINVPFHTNFLAGLWCILASAFEMVYFTAGWCLFYKSTPRQVKLVRDILFRIENVYTSLSCSNHSNAFAQDVISLFDSNRFSISSCFVPSVLNVYNNFKIPPNLGSKF